MALFDGDLIDGVNGYFAKFDFFYDETWTCSIAVRFSTSTFKLELTGERFVDAGFRFL